MLALYMLWPCVRLCLSVTSQCSAKTAKHRITQTKPHDSSRTLVSLMPKISAGAPNAGGFKIGDFRQIDGYISKTVPDRQDAWFPLQEVQLSPMDRAMRRVGWNVANCHATVQKLLVRQVLNKSKLWSWRDKVGRCVINMCTPSWRVRFAFIVL